MSNDLSKNEYLKKYLSSGSEKKKKKKKVAQSSVVKSRIVDDDIDLKNMKPVSDSELEIFDLAEEAPQIVGIIDDRPEEIRIMSEFRSTKKWKIVADEHGFEDIKISAIDKNKKNDSESPPRKSKDDESRKKQKNSDSDYSPPIKSKNDDSDASPPRRDRKKNEGNSRKSRNDDSDASPPRKNKRKDEGSRMKKKNDDSDASPPRKTIKKEIDSDASPPRRKNKNKDDSDASPPRRRNKDKDDSDASPPRRKSNSRFSDSRKKFEKSNSRDRGRNLNRRNVAKVVKKEESSSSSSSSESDSDSSSDRKGKGKKAKTQEKGGKSNKSAEEVKSKADGAKKTLSGKKAGLQDSKELRKESEDFRKKQSELFAKMSDEVSGRNATAIVRDRKTGRKRDFKEEARKKKEKEEKEAERLAQYAVWGKGVKQVEDRQEKIKEDLYEMSKPLARYAGDKDLDEMLKNQEWDGDPMLEYIRKKKKAKIEKSGGKSRPEYQGIFLPNRYGIKPGHRWDGVDRSNGYEKKWFEEQNAKKAREEEAFKWSTADM